MSVKYDPLSTVPGYACTRSGAKSELGADGVPIAFATNAPGVVPNKGYWSRAAATNVLLNAGAAASLATQSVTVAAVSHTLSFIGTGSVTLSGAHVATLTGTGVNNRVVLVFTPTAGSLTLTVTGSVTYAGLIAGNLSDGGPIISTTTAAITVGADVLDVTASLPAGDFIVWVVADLKDATAEAKVLIEANDAALSNRVELYRNFAGTPIVYVQIAGVGVYDVGVGAAQMTGRRAMLLRYSGGKYKAFSRNLDTGVDGSAAESAVVGNPSAITRFQIGHVVADAQAGGLVEGVYQRNGTFSDAECSAILAAA